LRNGGWASPVSNASDKSEKQRSYDNSNQNSGECAENQVERSVRANRAICRHGGVEDGYSSFDRHGVDLTVFFLPKGAIAINDGVGDFRSLLGIVAVTADAKRNIVREVHRSTVARLHDRNLQSAPEQFDDIVTV